MADKTTQIVEVLIGNPIDVITARRCGLDMATKMGFIQPEATKIAVVISELARNIQNYAGLGRVTLMSCQDNQPYFEIVARDAGPGIPDVNRALTQGYSTSRGMGVGLPGSKRLMDEFKIESKLGLGTTVTARKWLR